MLLSQTFWVESKTIRYALRKGCFLKGNQPDLRGVRGLHEDLPRRHSAWLPARQSLGSFALAGPGKQKNTQHSWTLRLSVGTKDANPSSGGGGPLTSAFNSDFTVLNLGLSQLSIF